MGVSVVTLTAIHLLVHAQSVLHQWQQGMQQKQVPKAFLLGKTTSSSMSGPGTGDPSQGLSICETQGRVSLPHWMPLCGHAIAQMSGAQMAWVNLVSRTAQVNLKGSRHDRCLTSINSSFY